MNLVAAKDREKAEKAAAAKAQQAQTQNQKGVPGTIAVKKSKSAPGAYKTAGTPAAATTSSLRKTMTVDQRQLDIAGLNLDDDDPFEVIPDEPAKPAAAVEKLIEEARAALTAQEKSEKRSLTLVVVGERYLAWRCVLD